MSFVPPSIGSRTQPLSAIEARTRPATRGTTGDTTEVEANRIVPRPVPLTCSTSERSRVLGGGSGQCSAKWGGGRRAARAYEEPVMPFMQLCERLSE